MMAKAINNIIGHFAVSLGILGIFLPILPTTPFLLLASICYSKGSEKFQNWLKNHKVLGPPISNWKKHGTIALKVKILVIPFIFLNLTFVVFLGKFHNLIKYPVALISLGLIVFIVSRPTRPHSQ